MIRKNAFIYPCSGTSSTVSNPYIEDFISSLSSSINFLNQFKPSGMGILNLYTYLGRIDMVFLNWIEDLPDKRAGLMQTALFVILIYILRIKKIKIFYTLHNKESHYITNRIPKRFLRRVLLKNADFLLTHSSDGLKLLQKEGIRGKVLCIPHPFKATLNPVVSDEKKYDILIWGAIRPYKGIDPYLRFLHSKGILRKYKTLIAGRIFPEEYEHELDKYRCKEIKIVNSFLEDETLAELIGQSRIVLFTYHENSVLSSGALIYSLSLRASVIGPNAGAFRDVYNKGLIEVFDDYDELIGKIDARLNTGVQDQSRISRYIQENTWEKFGLKIGRWIGYHPGESSSV